MLTRLAPSIVTFASFGFLASGASGAVVYTYGGPSSSQLPILVGNPSDPGSTNIDINIDGVGNAEVTFFIDVNAGNILTFQISQKGSIGLKIAEVPSPASFSGSSIYGGPVPTAQRVDTVLGITPDLNYDDDRGVLSSNSVFANESDGQWSNGMTSSPVSGFIAMTFERTIDGISSTHLGFLEVEVNESSKTASIISYGFNDQEVTLVPEPSSALLILIGSLLIGRRHR